MDFIRPREIALYVIAACSVFACATGTTAPKGGGDGGDDTWGGSVASSSSSNSSSSSSSGGATKCDASASDCTTCRDCSRAMPDGLCVTEYDNCNNSAECVDFATCINNCADGDTVCYDDCGSFFPSGKTTFDLYASCVICTDCFVKCDGASACM